MTKEITDLQKIRALLEHGWTQRENARLADDTPCSIDDPRAQKYCLLGAWIKIGYYCVTIFALIKTCKCNNADELAKWNDHPDRTQEEVLALIDTTIEQLTSKKLEAVFNEFRKFVNGEDSLITANHEKNKT